MSEQVSRKVTITYSNAPTYLLGESGITVQSTSWGFNVCLLTTSTSYKYASLTDAAKDIIFPNTTAHPIKADISGMVCKTGVLSATATICFRVAGTSIGETSTTKIEDHAFTITGSTASVVTSSTKSTSYQYGLKTSSSSRAAVAGVEDNTEMSVTLYFTKYAFSASAGTGISSASVTNTTSTSAGYGTSYGYSGDTMQYTASVSSGYTFAGWYNGSTLVSTSQTYTTTVSADLALTAKANAATKTLTVTYNGSTIVNLTGQTASSISVTYNGSTIATLSSGSKTLVCSGKVMASNVAVGGKTLACSGKLMASNVVVTYS